MVEYVVFEVFDGYACVLVVVVEFVEFDDVVGCFDFYDGVHEAVLVGVVVVVQWCF